MKGCALLLILLLGTCVQSNDQTRDSLSENQLLLLSASTNSPSQANEPCAFVPDCPLRGTKYIGNPCPHSCQKYFECTEGSWTAKACLPWENFDPKTLSCTWWWKVDCSWLQPPPPVDELPTFPDLTIPSPIPPRPPCLHNPSCPSSGNVTLPDPCACQKYYKCSDGKPESKSCLPWENFEPKKLECVFMSDVDCDWPYGPPSNPPTEAPPNPPSEAPPNPPSEAPPNPPSEAPPNPPSEAPPNPPSEAPPNPPSEAPPNPPSEAPPKPPTQDPNICSFKPICPTVGKTKIPIPCSGYCEKYFECTNGVPVLKTCSKLIVVKRYFDPVSKECKVTGVDCDWYKDPDFNPKN